MKQLHEEMARLREEVRTLRAEQAVITAGLAALGFDEAAAAARKLANASLLCVRCSHPKEAHHARVVGSSMELGCRSCLCAGYSDVAGG